MTIRILWLTENYPPQRGGMAQSCDRLFNGLTVLFLIMSGCGKTSKKEVTFLPKEETTQTPAQSYQKQYYINTASNENLAEISGQGEQIVISKATEELFGVLKKEDKRKYYNQNDEIRYAVKYSDASFKLRDQNERLLWKIKISDKIKIANNEEMTNSYKISISDGAKIKVKRNDQEIAALRFDPDSPHIVVGEKYSVRNFGSSLALGILLIEEIPEEQKILICAELLKRQN